MRLMVEASPQALGLKAPSMIRSRIRPFMCSVHASSNTFPRGGHEKLRAHSTFAVHTNFGSKLWLVAIHLDRGREVRTRRAAGAPSLTTGEGRAGKPKLPLPAARSLSRRAKEAVDVAVVDEALVDDPNLLVGVHLTICISTLTQASALRYPVYTSCRRQMPLPHATAMAQEASKHAVKLSQGPRRLLFLSEMSHHQPNRASVVTALQWVRS